MSKPLKDTPIKPLPSFIRQRLTLQTLLTNPQQYIKNINYCERPQRKEEVVIEERASPKPSVVSERTQTKDVLDAETNTKMTRFSMVESQKSKLKSRCTTALAKGAILASRSPYVEIARRLRQDTNDKQQKIPLAKDSMKEIPEVKRRRGILKKVLEDVTLEGMCSTGTTTDKKQPTLDRILKENHIFLKYSKSCKSKKKRVRMDKKPAFFFTKRDQDSVQSLNEASEIERPKRVSLPPSDENDNSSEHSEDDASLERKPARLILRASSGEPDQPSEPSVSDASDDDSRLSSVSNMSSAPQLCGSDKLSSRPLQRQVPQLRVRADFSQDAPKKPPCGVPKERLYFKNMFLYFPYVHSVHTHKR
ncbi:uncharacterized protein LOC133530267 [Cydia pomonella]|uniref:uncharacterized protein LOC133530267 n=1 Tax=Cydia pomonella TaxID=82600 RepID=UPI002ADE7F64|nr:uncharacterized protein LOC133530267 [Cydia pomonella]